MSRHTRIVLPLIIMGVAVALSGCSSSSDDSASDASSDATTTTTPSAGTDDLGDATSNSDEDGGSSLAASVPDDPCSLLTADDVLALTGRTVDGTDGLSSTSADGPPFSSCQWGSLTEDVGQVSVAVSAPGEVGIDYLDTLIGAVDQPSTPSGVGEDGEVLDVFIRPGGGGVGKSVHFSQNGVTAVVSQAGDAVDPAKLEAAAQQVSSRL